MVVGRSLNVSGLPAPEFLKTSLGPSEMTSLEAEGGFLGFAVGFEGGIDGDDQRRVPSVSSGGYATVEAGGCLSHLPFLLPPPQPPPPHRPPVSLAELAESFYSSPLLFISDASMAHFNVVGELQNRWNPDEKLRSAISVRESSPLFMYSPPGAWIDTPLELNGSPSIIW